MPKAQSKGFGGGGSKKKAHKKKEPKSDAGPSSSKKEQASSDSETELLHEEKTDVLKVKTKQKLLGGQGRKKAHPKEEPENVAGPSSIQKEETSSDSKTEQLQKGKTDVKSQRPTSLENLLELVENDTVISTELKVIIMEQTDKQNDKHLKRFTLFKVKELLLLRLDFLTTLDRFKNPQCRAVKLTGIEQALEKLEVYLKEDIKGYNSEPGNIPGCYQSHQTNCVTCNDMRLGRKTRTTFRSIAGEEFTIKKSLTCISTNIIYLISCRDCGCQYVGSTTKDVRKRMKGHRPKLRGSGDRRKLYRHFNDESNGCKAYDVIVIDRLEPVDESKSDNKERLLELEQDWIDQLDTLENGLNERRSKRLRIKNFLCGAKED